MNILTQIMGGRPKRNTKVSKIMEVVEQNWGNLNNMAKQNRVDSQLVYQAMNGLSEGKKWYKPTIQLWARILPMGVRELKKILDNN